ncbi:hypothetical protein QQS21_003125 [Conoideocrella luteorostrata]|uniref:Cytochrome P450 monooxygenase n=1 Tax=Conoideocrella luteorostrata TaxID=1105319 RepID=A0AAJ0CXV9_9HYPO|nr:hypothetical protein QQS21_003125 [Conoideocrella luteorostrata]
MNKILLNRTEVVPVLALAACIFCILKVIYNVFFHPLRKYPGPLICKAIGYYRIRKFMSGRLPHWLEDLHAQYGPVVRIAPNELSFTYSEAWKDIYNTKNEKTGKPWEMHKYKKFYGFMGPKTADNILNAGYDEHAYLRQHLAPSFASQMLGKREVVIQKYADLLTYRLREESQMGTQSLNLRDWFTYFTFDIIGHLGFGVDFGCLNSSKYHPWVGALTKNLKEYRWVQFLMYIGLDKLVHLITNNTFLRAKMMHENLTKEMLKQSLANPDMVRDTTGLLDALVSLKRPALSFERLHSNLALIIIAGSETNATLLVSIASILAEHPAIQQKVADEIRSAFKNEEEITMPSVNRLKYLMACIDEAMRLFPPAAIGGPRVVPQGGATVAGHYVPQGTIVAVAQWAAYHSPDHFAKPQEYHPERWLEKPANKGFENDCLKVFQPFGVGHRDCIARNLAHVESRLVLAKLIWNFNIRVRAGHEKWREQQKSYLLWDKKDFFATMEPVR